MAENRAACLIEIKSEGNIRNHLILKDQFVIGRSNTADLPLLDLGVSRQHARIQIKDGLIILQDLGSSNGVKVNGQKIQANVDTPVTAQDQIMLGTSTSQFRFNCVLAPMESLSPEDQKKILLESMGSVEKEIENIRRTVGEEVRLKVQSQLKEQEEASRLKIIKSQQEHEQKFAKSLLEHDQKLSKSIQNADFKISTELHSAKARAEKILAEAREQAEATLIHGLADFEVKRDKLKAEGEALLALARTEVQKQDEVARNLIDKAHQEIKAMHQKEAILAKQKADFIIGEAEQKYAKRLDAAEVDQKRAIEKATLEAAKLLQEADHKAKVMIDEAKKRSDIIAIDAKKRALHEIEESKRASIDAIRVATYAEQEKIIKEYRGRIDGHQEKTLELEGTIADHEAKLEGLMNDRQRLKDEILTLEKHSGERRRGLADLEEEYSKAQKVIQAVTSAETKRDEAKKEMAAAQQQSESFRDDYNRQVKSIQDDLQKQREQTVIEFREYRRKQEEEIAHEKLAAFESLKKQIDSEEARYLRTISLRSAEIASAVAKSLLPKIETDFKARGLEYSSAGLLDSIKVSVDQVVLKEPANIKPMTEHLLNDPEKVAARKKTSRRVFLAASAVVAVVLTFFANPIYNYFKMKADDRTEQRADSLKRNLESVYTPVQNDDWHETYTGNVLYLRYYIEAKLDPVYQEQWLLRLNNLEQLRALHLSEDDMIQFVGKERALILQLSDLRQSIDAKFLDQGLEKMNQAESLVTTEMKQVLKSDENLIAVRKIERDFALQYIKLKFGGSSKERAPSEAKAE